VAQLAAAGRHRYADEAMRAGSRSRAFRGRVVGDRHHRGAFTSGTAGQDQGHRRLALGHESIRDHERRVVADRTAASLRPS
jgi:hypothetical protein